MQDRVERFDAAAAFLSPNLARLLMGLPDLVKAEAQEIRLRVDKPLSLHTGSSHLFISRTTGVYHQPYSGCTIVTSNDIAESFRCLCGHSVHSHANEIKEGYIAVPGGHRAGICGTLVTDGQRTTTMREITSINLRIAREIKGAADSLFAQIYSDGLPGLLLVGAPSSGKTTLLRDLARLLASGGGGRYRKVAVIDERGELAAGVDGHLGNDLGFCTDVLSGCRKGEGILTALRSLSPEVIICDEVGSPAEVEAIKAGLGGGAAIIATMHAGSLRELCNRPQTLQLLQTGAFERVAMLSGAHSPSQLEWIKNAGELYAEINRYRNDYNLLLGQRDALCTGAFTAGGGA